MGGLQLAETDERWLSGFRACQIVEMENNVSEIYLENG